MLRKWIVPVAALGLLVGMGGLARAADDKKADKGTVSGTVMDKDGKAAANVTVRVAEPPKDDAKTDTGAKPKPNVIATGMTDADGKFEIKDVAPGTYIVMAGGKGIGNARQTDVEVKAGETATVSLTLKMGKKKAAA